MSVPPSLEVDLRSDTVTRPSAGMRAAMAAAAVGDDVFGDDPTVQRLQEMAADLTGKEAGLFVPSCTMANLLCVMSHCWGRGLEILIGDTCHIHLWEQGNIAQFGGVHPRTLRNLPDGTFDLGELRAKVREDDPHHPVSSLVCIENTQNKSGGVALPLQWIKELGIACRELGLPLHCDGARIFNAAERTGTPIRELVEDCDSVSICLSKGLGAPVGAVVVGSKTFIARALRLRKALGGGMRQCGIIAAGGIYALEHNIPELARDRKNTERLAEVIETEGSENFTVNSSAGSTNLLFFSVKESVANAGEVVARLAEIPEAEVQALGHATKVLSCPFSEFEVRLVCHLDINDEMMEKSVQKLAYVVREFNSKH